MSIEHSCKDGNKNLNDCSFDVLAGLGDCKSDIFTDSDGVDMGVGWIVEGLLERSFESFDDFSLGLLPDSNLDGVTHRPSKVFTDRVGVDMGVGWLERSFESFDDFFLGLLPD